MPKTSNHDSSRSSRGRSSTTHDGHRGSSSGSGSRSHSSSSKSDRK